MEEFLREKAFHWWFIRPNGRCMILFPQVFGHDCCCGRQSLCCSACNFKNGKLMRGYTKEGCGMARSAKI